MTEEPLPPWARARRRPLAPAEPEFFFWLRHGRRAAEPLLLAGPHAPRVARPLAEQGIRSMALLPDAARNEAGEGRDEGDITWLAGDLPGAALPGRGGMAALPGDHLERFLTLAEQRAVLKRLHDWLQVGGKLIVTAKLPDPQALLAVPGDGPPLRALPPLEDEATGRRVLRWAATEADAATQRLRRHELYEEVDGQGLVLWRWARTVERSYFWPREMQLLLEGAGFLIEGAFGDWNDEALDGAAARQLWVARKSV